MGASSDKIISNRSSIRESNDLGVELRSSAKVSEKLRKKDSQTKERSGESIKVDSSNKPNSKMSSSQSPVVLDITMLSPEVDGDKPDEQDTEMPTEGCLPQMSISGELCPSRIKTSSKTWTGKVMDLSGPDVLLSNKVSNRKSNKNWDASEIREGNNGVNGSNLGTSYPPILLSPITDSGFNSTSISPSWANVVRLSGIIGSPTREIASAKIDAQWEG